MAEVFAALAQDVFRLLRRPEGREGPRPSVSVAITSACAAEGKTSVAQGLALHAAALGRHRVLLVDAHFQRPALSRTYDAAAKPGLSDFLAAAEPIEPALLPTPLANLSVIGAGQVPRPMLLFRENAIRGFCTWAAGPFDIVLLDCGSFDAATKVVTDQVDKIVFVVDAGRTRRSDVRRAVEQVQGAERILGVVLNKQRRYLPRLLDRAS